MTPRQLNTLVEVLVLLFMAFSMLAVPHLAHRGLLFGVPVPEGFRSTETGRKALRSYRLWIATLAAFGLLGMMLFPVVTVPALLAIPVVGITAFVSQNRKLKPYAIQPPPIRQASLDPPEGLPWFVWLGLVPLCMFAGSAAYLHSHWDRIPLRYPVHFDFNGTPNRWAERTTRGVYGLLLFGAELAVFLFVMALAGWYGSRRSDPMRKPATVVLLAAAWIMGLLFSLLPLKLAAGVGIPMPLMLLGPLALAIPVLGYAFRQSMQPRDPVDPTPNECWKAGIIYYNPNDAVLFVQRRDSMGFTLNMANPWSWMIFAGLMLVLSSAPLLLR